MSTLSTSIYGSSVNKGFGGLVSGLDTDDLVKQMTARTRNKIDRQYQAKQKLLYRQEAYREISSKLLDFNNKYFSYSTNTGSNILSTGFFSSYTIESSSKYVNVSGDADNIKNFSIIDIPSVATSSHFSSSKTVSLDTFRTSEITEYMSSIAGETMTIEYGGKAYNLKIDQDFGKGSEKVDLEDVAAQLNKQIDKIDDLNGGTQGNSTDNIVKYSVEDGKLVVSGPDPDSTVKLTAASSKIINSLKFTVGQAASSSDTVDPESLSVSKADILSNEDAYITFDFNGITKKINLDESITDETELKDYLQSELNRAFGEGNITVGFDEENNITFKATGTNSDTDLFGVSDISGQLRNFIGIESNTYNRINKTKAISETNLSGALVSGDIGEGKTGYTISVNGREFSFEETATLNDIINTINKDSEAGVNIYYSSITDTFTVKATETGSHNGVEITDVTGNLAASLFGSGAKDLNDGEYMEYDAENDIYNVYKTESGEKTNIGTATYDKETNLYTIKYSDENTVTSAGYYEIEQGTDTVITYTLNGAKSTVTRSTAVFSIDGINVELNEKAANSVSLEEPAEFTVTNNTGEVVEKVKQFIDDYNEIITLISGETREKPDRDYQPLTPEQQEEMTEDEIKNWNEKAREGILFGDSKINNVLNSLRGAMSGKTSVSSLVLADMGISAGSMDTSGKLIFDEEKFKAELAQNPEDVAALFTGISSDENGVSGIAVQIQSILKENVGSYGISGILIEEAGLDNTISSNQNFISERIEEYDERMAELKDYLERERQRYWNKFSALESALNNLNSQSSWLTDLMGS